MSEPLELRRVVRTYRSEAGDLPVLCGVDLVLKPGEITALVAPSGAGKSTLLHLAGLLEKPDGGEVLIDGRDASQLPDAARTAIRRDRIGFVYQFHHLLAEFTALENVAMPLIIAGKSRAEANARALLLLTGWPSGRRIIRASCRAANSSAWRLPVRWPTSRACCWPMSRRAISMSPPLGGCSASCCRSSASRGWRR